MRKKRAPSEIVKSEIHRMTEQGVSLSRISQVAEVDRTTLWKWLYGESPRGIGSNSLDRLCDMFGLMLVSRQAVRSDLLAKADKAVAVETEND